MPYPVGPAPLPGPPGIPPYANPPYQTSPIPANQPYVLRDTLNYAVDQERQRHDESLYNFGEYSILCLRWNVFDYEEGNVQKCSTCMGDRADVSAAYQQVGDTKCPNCYGTTYEGGYRALIVRPCIWSNTEEDSRPGMRGQTTTSTASVQTTGDVGLRTGDYIFRGDGTRWQMRTQASTGLVTGFDVQTDVRTTIGYNYGTCGMEDLSSVAYLIPPPKSTLLDRLGNRPHQHYPQDFSDIEVVRGRLLLPDGQ